ncbi:MAG: hypothetical protein NTW16_09100 [Bacteroidetes bacterium]|nr:hypothetical protein [Bacteroidota bacterium]
MKKHLLIFSFIALCSVAAISQPQQLIAVDHAAGGSEFFTRLDSAIVHAANRDNIYLPGITMSIGTQIINKRVQIYGSGINPDSALSSGRTILTGNLRFVTGADSGFIQGVFVDGSIIFGTDAVNQNVGYYSISRCVLNSLSLSYANNNTTTSNFLIRESIIRNVGGGGYSHAVFNNNIFESPLYYFNGAIFSNNIFLTTVKVLEGNITNSTFSNNIFAGNCLASNGCTDNNFYNNLIKGGFLQFYNPNLGYCDVNYSPNGNGSIAGNIENVPANLIYQNQTGGAFVFQQNYHLVPASPGKNAGTDGTDVGIYGGPLPFKDGSLPVNPHYRLRMVSGTTTAAGQLPVHFKVIAQDH